VRARLHDAWLTLDALEFEQHMALGEGSVEKWEALEAAIQLKWVALDGLQLVEEAILRERYLAEEF